MILNTTPQNEAILSNVGQIGEFRIRNSAKAFNILSSGLYANKIRAIIRELSCNAVDSHVAAGRADTPFDVHLPSQLEPWFAIRDYGLGLDHEQVVNIYTTYFESTKTDSNEYIGALGLGSKSPFSYTDNFTVTAIKDGIKGIYTAFINEQGIPSIARMMQESSNDPNGVEVRFSVNERYDYAKFIDEARQVYTYFTLRPVITGVSNFEFHNVTYDTKDIIPGVHSVKHNSTGRSFAVMGNIAYPIEIPNAEQTLGDLRNLLGCGLEMHFGIGELDFQASREGLSYIPQTVDAIKSKLALVNDALVVVLARDADAIPNLWDRAIFLANRKSNNLWTSAVSKYANANPIPTYDPKSYAGTKVLELKVADVAKQFNVVVKGFTKVRGTMTMSPVKLIQAYGPVKQDGTRDTWQNYNFLVNHNDHFVINDLRRGALERSKYHYRETKTDVHSRNVFVLDRFDRDTPADFDGFFTAIHCPPTDQRLVASTLLEKNREYNSGEKASVLVLTERRQRYNTKMVWESAGTTADFDSTKNYYYVEMVGWNPVGAPMADFKEFVDYIGRAGLFYDKVYAVRKADIEVVRKQKNWIELTGFIRNKLQSIDMSNLMGLVKEAIDFRVTFKYINDSLNQTSPYYKLYAEFKDVEAIDSNKKYYFEQLLRAYGIVVASINPDNLIKDYRKRVDAIKSRYPLLENLSGYGVNVGAVVDYINMIDKVKGFENESI